ncbi:MAG: hypothetical protein KAT27_07435, partial [Desulfobacterales bacterium]|nr:hypothetical protein [Desulfobacterales bacterium]
LQGPSPGRLCPPEDGWTSISWALSQPAQFAEMVSISNGASAHLIYTLGEEAYGCERFVIR